jgi:acyl carrier protein
MPARDDKQALSPTEITVGEIWMEALQFDRINADDNFFERGGDSLMTMMMLFRVNDVLNVDMPPDSLMDAPTLREFCRAIDNRKSVQSAANTDNTETGVI